MNTYKCQKFRVNDTEKAHNCPYDEDVRIDDDFCKKCDCCVECTETCRTKVLNIAIGMIMGCGKGNITPAEAYKTLRDKAANEGIPLENVVKIFIAEHNRLAPRRDH